MKKNDLISKIIEQKEKIGYMNSPYELEEGGKVLLSLLSQLIKEVEKDENPDENELTNFSIAYENLSHTIDKEVQYAISSYKESKKRNAARKRETEYEADLKKAISQIYRDLYSILALE